MKSSFQGISFEPSTGRWLHPGSLRPLCARIRPDRRKAPRWQRPPGEPPAPGLRLRGARGAGHLSDAEGDGHGASGLVGWKEPSVTTIC